MSLTIHHYYPLGSRNTGDELVAHAVRQALRERLGESVDVVPMAVNDRLRTGEPIGLRGVNIERTNAEADAVVIGGSNLLEPRKRGGWGVFTDVESIASLRPPLLLIGMGTGSDFARRIRRFREPAISQVRALHERASLAAVRDDVTVHELARIGVNSTCTGCPVTFLTDRPIAPTTAADGPLIVSLPPTRLLRSWLGRRFLAAAMRYISRMRDRDDVELLVTLHDSGDIEPARDLVPPGVDTFFSDDIDTLVHRFEQCRGVVGFRLHAALLGLGLGKPVIPVGLDWRGLAFIQTADVADLSIRALRPGQFTQLRQLTDRLLASDPQMIDRLTDAKHRLAERHHTAIDTAVKRLGHQLNL